MATFEIILQYAVLAGYSTAPQFLVSGLNLIPDLNDRKFFPKKKPRTRGAGSYMFFVALLFFLYHNTAFVVVAHIIFPFVKLRRIY
jgi:hypothetical protein